MDVDRMLNLEVRSIMKSLMMLFLIVRFNLQKRTGVKDSDISDFERKVIHPQQAVYSKHDVDNFNLFYVLFQG